MFFLKLSSFSLFDVLILYLFFPALLGVQIFPHRQTIDVGDAATFTCDITGYPVQHITWYKDGDHLVTSDRVTLTTDGVTMVIESVERSDRGMYQCMAANQEQEVHATAQLSLGGKIYRLLWQHNVNLGTKFFPR